MGFETCTAWWAPRLRCPACDTPLGEHERLTCHCDSCGIRAEERIVDPGQRFAHPGELMQALQRPLQAALHLQVEVVLGAHPVFLPAAYTRTVARLRCRCASV